MIRTHQVLDGLKVLLGNLGIHIGCLIALLCVDTSIQAHENAVLYQILLIAIHVFNIVVQLFLMCWHKD